VGPRLACPPDTLSDLIRRQAEAQPDAVALCAPGRRSSSYADLAAQVAGTGAALRALGVTPATRVAVVLPNGPEMASAFLGVASAAVCAPLNPGFRAAEFRYYLEDLGARVLVRARGHAEAAAEAARERGVTLLEVDIDPAHAAGRFVLPPAETPAGPAAVVPPAHDAVALILHTSGTTARPKIVPLTHANLVASARHIAGHLALTPSDRALNVMPLFHIHGLVGTLLATLASGGSVVCTPGARESAFFDWVAAFEPTWYSAVPTVHQAIVAMGARYRDAAPGHVFRFVRSSSAALPPRTLAELEALTGAPVVEAYGMTEAAHQMACNPLPPRVRKPGSVGLPSGAEIALMDAAGRRVGPGATGEIVIRGPGVMSGYENRPEANAAAFVDGWFRTGDEGRFDADGYLFITGRLKEMVNRGGEKVSPREIDEALLEHPAVAQAAAFAVPHASLGEDLAAAVVARPGVAVDEGTLRESLFGRLAAFKVPSRIVFVDEIPKGATGKVQRSALHERLADRLAQAYVAPAGVAEVSIAGVVAEVLGVAEIGRHDNFFALGGDSLSGARVIARLHAMFGVGADPTLLFRHPTVAALAAIVDATPAAATLAELAAEIDAMSDEDVARALAEAETPDRGSPPGDAP